jgi:beta-lactam-binding protein with PASTA domain
LKKSGSMDFLKFLASKLFFRHLGLAVTISLFLLLFTLLWLRIYTRHGQAIGVPDLAGLTLEEVGDVADSRNLRYTVVDSVFSTEVPRGTVVKQTPTAGSTVKRQRKIFLTMNAVNPETVSMPRLVGLSIRQARLALQNAGLVLGDIRYRPDYAVNNVLQQIHGDSVLTEGTEVKKGEMIDLVLGAGLSNETTRVPSLTGLGMEAAREVIADHFLNLGAVTFDGTVATGEDSAIAFIWRQYPGYDEFSRLNLGMEMDIWLTIDSTLLPPSDTLLTGEEI